VSAEGATSATPSPPWRLGGDRLVIASIRADLDWNP
jgi:hypothetical protein